MDMDKPIWKQIEEINKKINKLYEKIKELKPNCEHPTLEDADGYSEGGSCFGYDHYPGWVRCTVCGFTIYDNDENYETIGRDLFKNGTVIKRISSYERKYGK